MDQRFPKLLFNHLPGQSASPSRHPTNIHGNFSGKVFCIGFNKTGSKSISRALEILGFHASRWHGPPPHEALLLSHKFSFLAPWYADQNLPLFLGTDDISWLFHHPELLAAVKQVSQEASNFGDSPWLYLYPILQQWYPEAKFILTKRNSTYDVVNSALKMIMRTRFPGRIFSPEDYIKANVFQTNLQEYLLLTARGYERHNENVEAFFNEPTRAHQLLVLNLEEEQGNPWSKLADFLDAPAPKVDFPMSNTAPSDQQRYLLPEYFDLNWKNYSFNDKFQRKFELLHSLENKPELDQMDWELLREIYQPRL